ncbi:MAG: hypothetical protein AABX98_06565 [Nanoarchaeota archaeon]
MTDVNGRDLNALLRAALIDVLGIDIIADRVLCEVEKLGRDEHLRVVEGQLKNGSLDPTAALQRGEITLAHAVRLGYHREVAALVNPNTYRDVISGVAGWY